MLYVFCMPSNYISICFRSHLKCLFVLLEANIFAFKVLITLYVFSSLETNTSN